MACRTSGKPSSERNFANANIAESRSESDSRGGSTPAAVGKTRSGSALSIDINVLTLGGEYDQLSVTGDVNITGSTLSLSGTYLTSPAITNELFTIGVSAG